MMTFAESLSDSERRCSAWRAICSTFCGCIGEMAIDTGAIVVVYIAMMGGTDATKMLVSGLGAVATIVLSLFFGVICDRFGLRRGISVAGNVAFLSFMLMAAAPYFGELKLPVMLLSCLLYSMTRPLYTTGWYPILDNFLRPQDRAGFFSKMRFCYSTFNAILLFGIGYLFKAIGGPHPPYWLMQAILVLCAIGNLGRVYFINSIPIAPELKNPPLRVALHRHGQQYSLKEGLRISFRNGPLMGFCVYFCLYNIIACSFIPLSVVYMNSDEFHAPASAIVSVAAISLVGKLAGFLACGAIVKKIGTKTTILLCHFSSILLPLTLFFCTPTSPARFAVIGTVQFLAAFFGAYMAVVNSMESLALARPGNKTIALAVCSVFCNLGTAVGSFATTALLACGLLASHWTFHSISITKFQSIFGVGAIVMTFFLVLLVIVPAFVPKHEDFYEP